MSGWQRIFGMRSASNVIHKTLFFMLVGSPVDRLAAPFRVAIRSLKFMVFSFARHLKHG